ncbi:MAG: hypothetical protein KF688_11490 [Pirellulales bacterium]|nr:hypothetical protein [Pirellulales bacterium]
MPSAPRSGRLVVARLCAVGAAAGVLVAAGGLAWNMLAPNSWVWSDEQARDYAEATVAMHQAQQATVDASRPDFEAVRRQVEAARQRYERLHAELGSARETLQARGSRLIQWGCILTAACGIGYVVLNQDQS